MRPSVYIETTIIGYLASKPSRDLVTAANQQITRDWWDEYRAQFELFVSEAVVDECAAGNEKEAGKRLDAIADITILDVTDVARELSKNLVKKVPLPKKAKVDALHIAIAAANGIDYLLTWNCSHIANVVLRRRIEEVCRSSGFTAPAICTPQEFKEV